MGRTLIPDRRKCSWKKTATIFVPGFPQINFNKWEIRIKYPKHTVKETTIRKSHQQITELVIRYTI